jgi:hypothetical protein
MQDSFISINDLKKVVNINKEKLGIVTETKKAEDGKDSDVCAFFSCVGYLFYFLSVFLVIICSCGVFYAASVVSVLLHRFHVQREGSFGSPLSLPLQHC